MKKYLAVIMLSGALIMTSSSVWAQQTKLPPLALSPMDMAYYPPGYSMVANVEGKSEKLIARIIYCRPQIKGRVIFGGLVPYGKVWRLGANQATELTVFSPVTIGGHHFQPGRYTMYAIPEKDKWTIILNSQTDTWGAFGYHQDKDIVRTDVPVTSLAKPVEAFTMIFEKAPQGCNLVMAWDKAEVKLPMSF